LPYEREAHMSRRVAHSQTPNDAELDGFAFHVGFEVVTLVAQVECYIDTHGPIFPASSSPQPDEQALLEASLVHLRLLNEFLGCTGTHKDDVRANFWPGWTPRTFLDDAVRERIHWQVAHMSAKRTHHEWYLATYARDCCDLLLEFFDAIPAERLNAFQPAPEVAENGKTRFEAAINK
jgi:hypothetical protein